MTKLRDIHQQVKRLMKQDTEDTSVVMAFNLLDRALEKATRRPHTPTQRGQYEYFCIRCTASWPMNEVEPDTDCKPAHLIHRPILQSYNLWCCTNCGVTWAVGTDEPVTDCGESFADVLEKFVNKYLVLCFSM